MAEQTSKPIFVSFDFFHAGIYSVDQSGVRARGDRENYAHENPYIYVVASAYILRAVKNTPEGQIPVPGTESFLTFEEYLQSWIGGEETPNVYFVTADRKTIYDIYKGIPGSENDTDVILERIPVPFPQEISLQLAMKLKQGDKTISFDRSHTIGKPVEPFKLMPEDWFRFAAENFIEIPITEMGAYPVEESDIKSAADVVTTAQEKEILDWTAVLVQGILRKSKLVEDLSDVEKAVLTLVPDVTEKTVTQVLRDGIPFKGWDIVRLLRGLPLPPPYDKLALGKHTFTPPKPVYSRVQLKKLKNLYKELHSDPTRQLELFQHVFGDALGNGDDTYAEFLGREFGLKYKRALDTGKPEVAAEVVKNLKQGIVDLYAYGERLRWPKPNIDEPAGPSNKDLMILQPDIGDGWCITNAQSLLGQVFRIGPLDPKKGLDSITEVVLKVGGARLKQLDGTIDGDVEDKVIDGVKTLMTELKDAVVKNYAFSAKLERDRDNSSGLFTYVPRGVAGDTATELKSPKKKQIVRVPTSLLDALETTRRISFPPALYERDRQPRKDNSFRVERPPRRLLNPKALFTNGEYILEPEKTQDHKYRPFMSFKVQVRRLGVVSVNVKTMPVYEINLANLLHQGDHAAFRTRLLSAINSDGTASLPAELWISQLESDGKKVATPKSYNLTGRFIKLNGSDSRYGTDANGQIFFRIVDQETVEAKLGTLLANAPDANNASETTVFTVDLVMGVGRRSMFNILEVLKQTDFEKEGLTFHPNSVFTTKLSLSAERIHERFNLTLAPHPLAPDEDSDLDGDPVESEGILDDFANFNKMRLYLENPDDSNTPAISLTYPSALAPLPLRSEVGVEDKDKDYLQVHEYTEWKEGNPHFSYWIPHQFSEEIVGNEEDPNTDPKHEEDSTEVGRYLVRQHVGGKWQLNGHIENGYSYRVWIDIDKKSLDINLPLSDDIRHIAGVVNRQETEIKKKDGVEVNETKPVSPALVFTHVIEDDGTNERLVLRLNRVYAKEALAAYDNVTIDPVTKKKVQPGKRPAQLRELYDALMDIRHAATGAVPDIDVDTGALCLVLERWNFDNNKDVPRADAFKFPEMDREFPDIVGNLLFRDRGTYDVQPDDVGSWTDLLTDSFGGPNGFRANLQTAIDDLNHPAFENVNIPLGSGSPWRWTHDETGNAAISQSTNILRLGMIIRRPKNVVCSELEAGTRAILLKEQADKPDKLPRVDDDTRDDEFRKDLEEAARTATKCYLAQDGRAIHATGASRLHKSFHWVRSTPYDVEEEDPSGIPTLPGEKPVLEEDLPATRRRRLFGEIVDLADFPGGMRSRVERAVELYYVLFGFRPVARHPHFVDAQTTGEFLQFLVDLLSKITAGHRLDRFGIRESELDAEKTLELKFRAETIRDQLIDVLVSDFLRRVDDREGLLDDDKPISDTDKALFKKVDDQVNELIKESDNRSIPDAIKGALKRDLSLFNWAKAIGVGVFDKDTFSERLYSLMVHKKVRKDRIVSGVLPGGPADDSKSNQLRPLTFPHFLGKPGNIDTGDQPRRFFLEVLDDKRYDHDFEIAEITYANDPSSGQRMIAQRGAYGRTAESLIEMMDTYPSNYETEAGKLSELRNVEVDVVHYNPEWRYQSKDDPSGKWVNKYVLPSREAPETPQVLEPDLDELGDDDKRSPNPWFSEFPPEMVEGTDPHERFGLRIRELLVEGRSHRDGDKQPGFDPKKPHIEGEVELRPVDESLAVAEFDSGEGATDGWYHVDSYLTHYTFIVDGDEESRQSDGSDDMYDGFQNDTFVIEVESREKPYEDEEYIELGSFTGGIGLRDWFVYQQALSEQGAEEKPSLMSLDQALDEVEAWSLKPAKLKDVLKDKIPSEDLSILRPRKRPADTSAKNKVEQRVQARYTMSGHAGKLVVKGLQIDGASGKITALGSVVAVDALRMYSTDGKDQGRIVLRVTVLDDPWRHTRCRMSIRRNDVDVDGDLDPDINPDFVMASPYSDWAIYPPYFIIYTEDEVLDFAEPLRALKMIPIL